MDAKTFNDLMTLKVIHYLITPKKDWKDKSSPFFNKLMSELKNYLWRSPNFPKHINTSNAGNLLLGVNIPGAAVSQWSPSNSRFLAGNVPDMLKSEETSCAVIGYTSGAENDQEGEPPVSKAAQKKQKILRRPMPPISFKQWITDNGLNKTLTK